MRAENVFGGGRRIASDPPLGFIGFLHWVDEASDQWDDCVRICKDAAETRSTRWILAQPHDDITYSHITVVSTEPNIRRSDEDSVIKPISSANTNT